MLEMAASTTERIPNFKSVNQLLLVRYWKEPMIESENVLLNKPMSGSVSSKDTLFFHQGT